MPKAKKTEVEPEVAKEPVSVPVDHVDIYNGPHFVKTFSREVHGDNFQDLADQYLTIHTHLHKQ